MAEAGTGRTGRSDGAAGVGAAVVVGAAGVGAAVVVGGAGTGRLPAAGAAGMGFVDESDGSSGPGLAGADAVVGGTDADETWFSAAVGGAAGAAAASGVAAAALAAACAAAAASAAANTAASAAATAAAISAAYRGARLGEPAAGVVRPWASSSGFRVLGKGSGGASAHDGSELGPSRRDSVGHRVGSVRGAPRNGDARAEGILRSAGRGERSVRPLALPGAAGEDTTRRVVGSRDALGVRGGPSSNDGLGAGDTGAGTVGEPAAAGRGGSVGVPAAVGRGGSVGGAGAVPAAPGVGAASIDGVGRGGGVGARGGVALGGASVVSVAGADDATLLTDGVRDAGASASSSLEYADSSERRSSRGGSWTTTESGVGGADDVGDSTAPGAWAPALCGAVVLCWLLARSARAESRLVRDGVPGSDGGVALRAAPSDASRRRAAPRRVVGVGDELDTFDTVRRRWMALCRCSWLLGRELGSLPGCAIAGRAGGDVASSGTRAPGSSTGALLVSDMAGAARCGIDGRTPSARLGPKGALLLHFQRWPTRRARRRAGS